MENGSLNNQAALARHEELVVQELPDEVVVYDLKRHKAHCLNKTAAFVWNHCDGETTVTELARLLEQEAGSPLDERVVWYTLDKLRKADLLDGQLKSPVDDGLSRRRMIRRLGAMIVIPTVISLVAPTAVMAASITVFAKKIACGQCNQQDNPIGCVSDTCCTGNCGGPQRGCVCATPGCPPGPGGLIDTSCTGALCTAASAAAPCSSG
ncbi:MAG: PqqD family protein [Acidobacteriota bacterium]